MAGNWIKLEHITPDKPEIAQMAVHLNIDQDAVFGKCVRVWIWADQQTINGHDLPVTTSFLDRLTNCPGFSDGLLQVGWLRARNGRLSIPNFDRHNGQTAKNRALTADRVKRQRNDQIVTQSLPDQEGDKRKKKPPIPPFTDPWFQSPEFLEAWQGWEEMRNSGRVKLTHRMQKLGFRSVKGLAGEDMALAIRIIDRTVEGGWKGFFPPDKNPAPQRPRKFV